MRGGITGIIVIVATLMLWLAPQTGHAQLFRRAKARPNPAETMPTLAQVAAMLDDLDRTLFALGTIDIKSPDVWGQNRMTRHRDEFERTMYKQLNGFQEILQAAQRCADLAVLTSATALSFSPALSPAAAASGTQPFKGLSSLVSRLGFPSTQVVLPPSVVNNGLSGLPSLVASELANVTLPASGSAAASSIAPASSAATSTVQDPSNLLDSISKRLDALEQGTLNMPKDINQFATKEGKPGVGLEPTIRLDQEANYINHLHELRRVNAGDDLTDMAGYGLYLLRMPVSLLPGPASRRGKGAVVTMEARQDLSDDLLENTFRDVVVIDATYALSRAINDNIHATICQEFTKKQKANELQVLFTGDLNALPAAGENLVIVANVRHIFHFRIFDPDGKVIVDTDENARINQPGELNRTAAIAKLLNDVHALKPPPNLVTEAAKNQIIADVSSVFGSVDDGTQYSPKVSTYIGDLSEMIAMPSAITPTTGPGPAMTGDLRIILGPFDWPGLPVRYPKGFPPPVPNPFVLNERMKEGLFNWRDRLQLLIAAVEWRQKEPYRHDPTTFSLIRNALMETYRYMRTNASTNPMFQPPEVYKLAEMLFRRDLKGIIAERETFLENLVTYRNNAPAGNWQSQVTSTDVLAFVLLLQFAAVDQQLKEDMRIVAERRGCACGDLGHLSFYEFQPTDEAKQAFKAYVACKWPLHVYSVDPAIEQQNVLDAFSRRSELQLAIAVAVASGSMSANNATKFARRLEFDLETVGLNRTAVGFGAGETTFGWRFYPRVQSPRTESNPLRIANLLAWNGPGPNWDVKNREIEPGLRECIALDGRAQLHPRPPRCHGRQLV